MVLSRASPITSVPHRAPRTGSNPAFAEVREGPAGRPDSPRDGGGGRLGPATEKAALAEALEEAQRRRAAELAEAQAEAEAERLALAEAGRRREAELAAAAAAMEETGRTEVEPRPGVQLGQSPPSRPNPEPSPIIMYNGCCVQAPQIAVPLIKECRLLHPPAFPPKCPSHSETLPFVSSAQFRWRASCGQIHT